MRNDSVTINENVFDILRLLAAILVVASHSFRHLSVAKPFWLLWLADGSVGVMILFAMSGFLNMYSYEKTILNGGDFTRYIVRRILRLYPLLIVANIFMAFENFYLY